MDGLLSSWDSHSIRNETVEYLYLQNDFAVFNGLKATLKRDGNKWCASAGEWPEHNITGYGDSPYSAIHNLNIAYHTSIKKENQ